MASTKEKGQIQTRERQDQESKKDKLSSKCFVTFFFVFLCIDIEGGKKKADKSTTSLSAQHAACDGWHISRTSPTTEPFTLTWTWGKKPSEQPLPNQKEK